MDFPCVHGQKAQCRGGGSACINGFSHVFMVTKHHIGEGIVTNQLISHVFTIKKQPKLFQSTINHPKLIDQHKYFFLKTLQSVWYSIYIGQCIFVFPPRTMTLSCIGIVLVESHMYGIVCVNVC